MKIEKQNNAGSVYLKVELREIGNITHSKQQ
jgi:hypothetical protein